MIDLRGKHSAWKVLGREMNQLPQWANIILLPAIGKSVAETLHILQMVFG
jgi:hypothetical protein